MELVRRVQYMSEISREARGKGRKIGLVPTMGALHDGHLSLVRRARELTDIVVVSVFVNPAQFGPSEDFDRYPRDLARDADLCIQEGVDYLFAPQPKEIYPESFRTHIEVEGLSAVLEGATRPGHFRGVCTVVVKLLNIVRPSHAIFGAKDAQQAIILKRVVEDLNIDVEMVVASTVREEDGLALSSRNAYLSAEERKAALAIYRGLGKARDLVEKEGVSDADILQQAVESQLDAESNIRIDYVAIVGTEDLQPRARIESKALIAVAAWVGDTRLIDNVTVTPPDERLLTEK